MSVFDSFCCCYVEQLTARLLVQPQDLNELYVRCTSFHPSLLYVSDHYHSSCKGQKVQYLPINYVIRFLSVLNMTVMLYFMGEH